MSYMSVESRISGKQNRSSHSSEFSVVILGDFSGRASRGLAGPLSRLVAVDRDNFLSCLAPLILSSNCLLMSCRLNLTILSICTRIICWINYPFSRAFASGSVKP